MELTDSREIAADRATVWAALLDAGVLQSCIPGAQEVTGSPEEGFQAVVVQKVGPVKATFRGAVTLSDRVEGESLVLAGEGKGGAAGFAKGEARVRLEDSDAGTTLHYEVEAKVGGKLAQLGSRIIDGFAKKMADEFFTRFQTTLGGAPEGADAEAADAAAAEAGADTGEAAPKKGWLGRLTSRG